jgi:hypothetical protein
VFCSLVVSLCGGYRRINAHQILTSARFYRIIQRLFLKGTDNLASRSYSTEVGIKFLYCRTVDLNPVSPPPPRTVPYSNSANHMALTVPYTVATCSWGMPSIGCIILYSSTQALFQLPPTAKQYKNFIPTYCTCPVMP